MSERSEEARELFERFTGHELPEENCTIEIPDDLVVFPIGRINMIGYIATRDGVEAPYLHQFDVESMPVLCSSSDGEQLFIIAGSYQFTEDGIIDL